MPESHATIPAQMTNATLGAREVVVGFSDGHESRFNFLWLRDNCPSAGDKLSAIRSFTIADLDPDLAATAVSVADDNSLSVQWSNGEASRFEGDWLRRHCSEPSSTAARRREHALWSRETLQPKLPIIDFSKVEHEAEALTDFLAAIDAHGFALARNVPATAEGTEQLASTVGYIRENDFGRVFDIISEPVVWEMSQSSEALHPHTDDPYRYEPPGISILHCLEASGEGGGQSQIVDGFAAAEKLREDDPAAFDLLASVSVPHIRYRHDPVPQGDDVYLLAVAPVISLDRFGKICGLRFHERSFATLDIAPELMDGYYKALIKLAKLLYSEEFMITHHLAPGEAFVFDNQRVLHGRSGFEGSPGRRHMRICTTDRDAFHSRLRLALSRSGRPGADDYLPGGAL